VRVGRPAKIGPYKHIIQRINRRLYKNCIMDRKKSNCRLYNVSAWANWVAWEFRRCELTKSGFYIVDIQTVRNYLNADDMERAKHMAMMMTGVYVEPPEDWVEQSLETLLDTEVIFENYKNGSRKLYKPARWVLKSWQELDELEKTYAPVSDSDLTDMLQLSRKVKRLEAVLQQCCKVLGIDYRV
jgi:hypothetical protein